VYAGADRDHHRHQQQQQQQQQYVSPPQIVEQPHVPSVVEYSHGVEERALDAQLAAKIAEAERPKVPVAAVSESLSDKAYRIYGKPKPTLNFN
jgi:hypothetical protein